MEKTYICIDLKSFYASVECVERGLDPMTTDLVVADPERSKNTICLAVTPALKAKGIKNRCRLGDIPKNMDVLIATPRMQRYIDYSADIYAVYLKYFSKDDIHVYSIDEAFIDITSYLSLYKKTPREIAVTVMNDIYSSLGIRATCGIGTNLYLTKIALDIMAKHAPDFIGELDEKSYRETLWDHRPLTDFWRIGAGTVKRLEGIGLRTMRDITLAKEDILYKTFGIDAELLIDHAWGRESTTIKDIKAYRPKETCLSSSQVLMRDYSFAEAQTVLKEMADTLCLELVSRSLLATSLGLYVGYSGHENGYAGGSVTLPSPVSSDKIIVHEILKLYRRVTAATIPLRRLSVTFGQLTKEGAYQYSLFEDAEKTKTERELQRAINDIKLRFGKNSILRGISFFDEATARERNAQIGGHKSNG